VTEIDAPDASSAWPLILLQESFFNTYLFFIVYLCAARFPLSVSLLVSK